MIDHLGLQVSAIVFGAIFIVSVLSINDIETEEESKIILTESSFDVKQKTIIKDRFKKEVLDVLELKTDFYRKELSGGCLMTVKYGGGSRIVNFENCEYVGIDYDLIKEIGIEENKRKWCDDNPRKEFGFYGLPPEREIFYCKERRSIA